MPRGFERNIGWNDDGEFWRDQLPYLRSIYEPMRQGWREPESPDPFCAPSDYDLGFLASLRIKA